MDQMTEDQLRDTCATGEAKLIRIACNLTVAEVANAIGVGHTAVSRWERGLRIPRREAALRYAEILKSMSKKAVLNRGQHHYRSVGDKAILDLMENNIDWIRSRATLTVPEAGQALGISRDVAYAAAHRGEIPTLRLGKRLLVPVPKLLAMLGASEDQAADIAS